MHISENSDLIANFAGNYFENIIKEWLKEENLLFQAWILSI